MNQSQRKPQLVHRIKELLKTEFEPKTYQAFLMTAVDGKSGDEVAQTLGMSVGAVYKAKSRVLTRLRRLLDDPF